jgi:PAS domain-containing protein
MSLRERLSPQIDFADAHEASVPLAMLFENDRLVDATEPARRLLATGPRRLRTAERLIEILSPIFPELAARLKDIDEGGSEILRDSASGATLTAGRTGQMLRVVVENLPAGTLPPEADPATLDALDRELDVLQAAVDHAPILIWREDEKGAVRWANRAYLDLAEERAGTKELPGWPLPVLFVGHGLAGHAGPAAKRLTLAEEGPVPSRSFEAMVHPHEGQVTLFAAPADRLAQAERSLHDFVQTLSRTFADLPTGLAIFDKDRRLALFNPALTDLTALEPIYLATRPLLSDFLDALRNRQRMPEPKDYRGWRDRIASLEQAAANGSYLEDWSLPTGQTFRVTGQPHPNGGIAFLFEDISAEVSLTRSFREELKLGQAVIDAVEEAIAVFSPKSTLVLANDAYKRLWGNDPSSQLRDVTVDEVMRHWRKECRNSSDWPRIREILLGHDLREPQSFSLQLSSGRPIACRMTPLTGQAVLVGFTPGQPFLSLSEGDMLASKQIRFTGTLGA